MSEKPTSEKPPRPSESLRPGMPRFLATLMVDPMFLIVRLVVAVAEGITKAILESREKRKQKKMAKKAKKGEKNHGP